MIYTLQSADGAQAQIALNGAQVISWIPAPITGKKEQLFLSGSSSLDAGSAIRGGIPVIFPQFSNLGPLAKHGFARTQLWQLLPSEQPGSALFELRDNEQTRSVWPHAFLAQLKVTIAAAELTVELTIHNTGSSTLAFTTALHTYLRVDDIEQVRVLGLQGKSYRDSVSGVSDNLQVEDELSIRGQIDRIYLNAADSVTVQQAEQTLSVFGSGFADAVIWNPGADLGANLVDLEPQGYQRMLCVEAAAIAQPVHLQAGECWRGSQRLVVQL